MLTHEENPIHTFQCSVCSKPFKVKEYLKQHMRKHIGEKPYDCELCSKSFSAKNELNRHKISHSSARPFSCEHCGKKFKLKHNLTAHIKAHTGMQLFKCCLCKASFPQQCLMEKHKKSHTEVIQHLELVKTDPRTLTITSFPLDRRKVLHHQKVCLPPKLDLNDSHNASNSRVSLGLNDAFIPISVIANSFGTGNYIKMKIVDQIGPKNESKRKFPDMSGVTNAVLVDEDSMLIENAKEEESAAEAGHSNESKENVLEDSKTECSQTDPQSRFSSHFEVFEKTFNLECLDEAKLAWLQVLSDVVREFEFPLHYSVCQQLHLVTTKLQKILITHSLEEKPFGSTLDLHAPSCESCHLEEKEPLSDFPKPLDVKDEQKTSDKPKSKVQLCDSEGIGRDQLKRGRLKRIHKFYLTCLKVLQKLLKFR
ncbi:UNVERIFIED_CONTAM: hypothetical protein GTU68_039818 [Idotea baltica]|nr:hypothetical protein [Idotea baltica]